MRHALYLGVLLSTGLNTLALTARAEGVPELVEISEAQDFQEKGAWDGNNRPTNFSGDYEYNFERLNTRPEGRISDDKMPWSDTWWPNNRGGIANRWQVTEAYPSELRNLGNRTQERARVMRLNAEQIKRLSPAEKYDIAMGDYNFTVTRAVMSQTGPNAPDWFGICDGWTAAALTRQEPAPVTVTNPDGLRVEFGSSDVKGLLAHYHAKYATGGRYMLGKRCQDWWGNCEDVNAGAFHIVITNQIGFMNQAFGADVDGTAEDDPEFERTGIRKTRGQYQREIWNQPVFAYTTRVVSQQDCGQTPCRNVARGTVRRVRMQTIMTYADDDHPVWAPSIGTNDFFQESRRYDYWVEIDFRGNIVGGDWLTDTSDRPDYLWTASERTFTGMYEGLNRIYRPNTAVRPYCLPRQYAQAHATHPNEPIYPLTPVCAEE